MPSTSMRVYYVCAHHLNVCPLIFPSLSLYSSISFVIYFMNLYCSQKCSIILSMSLSPWISIILSYISLIILCDNFPSINPIAKYSISGLAIPNVLHDNLSPSSVLIVLFYVHSAIFAFVFGLSDNSTEEDPFDAQI
jgi:hypothetical protein